MSLRCALRPIAPSCWAPVPDAAIRLQVRKGMGAMPHFDEHHISPNELDAIVEYMKVIRHHG